MRNRKQLFISLLAVLLSACNLTMAAQPTQMVTDIDIPGQVATDVATTLTQTANQAILTPSPGATELPVITTSQRIFGSSILGVQFIYPDNWYLLETTDSQSATVNVTSFDPANPPHKLEWTDKMISLQIRLLPAGSVPSNLDAWVESAKQNAEATGLSISDENRFLIANQQATSLTLVSGSGGIIHQILVVLNAQNYEISIQGSLTLGKSVLSTLHEFSSSGLKPSEADTPAAGICAESQDKNVGIVLGLDQSGMPLAGRCVALGSMQRIKLINQSQDHFSVKFADYFIELPVGSELLLDKPVGEYLAPGIHYLPMGPELWVHEVETTVAPVATMPGPLRNYSSHEVGYSLTIPPGWNTDEHGLVNPSKEVLFYPGEAEPFLVYLSILLDPRTLDQIINSYAQNVPEAVREDMIFNGHPAVKFSYPYGRHEYYIPYENRILLISTDKPLDGNIQQMLLSIRFTSITVTR